MAIIAKNSISNNLLRGHIDIKLKQQQKKNGNKTQEYILRRNVCNTNPSIRCHFILQHHGAALFVSKSCYTHRFGVRAKYVHFHTGPCYSNILKNKPGPPSRVSPTWLLSSLQQHHHRRIPIFIYIQSRPILFIMNCTVYILCKQYNIILVSCGALLCMYVCVKYGWGTRIGILNILKFIL